jgi:thiamine transport system ATP-binding protein
VVLDGRDQAGVPVHRREVGLMFQDHQLFPQRDVAGNVGFGLRMHGAAKSERTARVAELLELVGLPGAGSRAVAALSGGEQQRVALARALAPRPRLLMLDEPLGQLDRSLRERLVVELRELFGRLGTTVLAVTHDQGEAFALADRVVVMRDGRIAQSGTPLQVWQRPADAFVARFLGFDNVVDATVDGEVAVTPWGKVPVPDGAPQGAHPLLVRPAGVRLVPVADGLRCTVTARTFKGTHVALHLQPEDAPRLEAACALRAAPEVGDELGVEFDASEVVVLG